MLIGINPLINPDVLYVLAAMGHGDCIALVDSNFPATSIATHTIHPEVLRMDCSTPQALQAILSLFPLDTFVDDAVRSMQVVGDPHAIPAVIAEASPLLGEQFTIQGIERYAFYEATKQSFAILQTGEQRIYGNLILRKGVIA